MHLGGGGGSVQYVEPAWHKALTAFLVNTAGSTGKDLVSNALARDYATAATAQGLPGATTPTTGSQSFWSKVLHGPEWDKERYQEATRAKAEADRFKATQEHWASQLGLSKEELQQRIKEAEKTGEYRQAELGLRGRELASQEAARRSTAEHQMFQTVSQAQANRENMLERMREFEARRTDPLARAQLAHLTAQTAALSPAQKAQEEVEKIKALQKAFPYLFPNTGSGAPGATNTATGQNPPIDNSAQPQPFSKTSPTVPGSAPVPASSIPEMIRRAANAPKTTSMDMPVMTQGVQGGGPDILPSAGMPGQYGQSSAMSATPPGVQDLGEPGSINQPQALAQHVGQNYAAPDLLALIRPPQTPNSPTAIQYSTPANVQIPLTQDTEAYRLAALLARKFGTADGMGGTPMAGGSGGLPLGYG